MAENAGGHGGEAALLEWHMTDSPPPGLRHGEREPCAESVWAGEGGKALLLPEHGVQGRY